MNFPSSCTFSVTRNCLLETDRFYQLEFIKRLITQICPINIHIRVNHTTSNVLLFFYFVNKMHHYGNVSFNWDMYRHRNIV